MIWWVLWVYTWFKHRYGNRDEKAHKTKQSGVKEKHRKKDRAIADRSGTICQSIGKNFEDQKQKVERLSIDRWIRVDQSARYLLRIIARSPIDHIIQADRSGVQWWSRQSDRRSIAGINRSIGKASWCKMASFSRLLRLWIFSKIRSKHVLYK